jgi:DNA-binding MarR family transcriptional regulator
MGDTREDYPTKLDTLSDRPYAATFYHQGREHNMQARTPIEGEDKRAATSLFNAMREFMRERGDMPAQYILSFLLVAMEEGQSVTDYARAAGVSNSVMSRHLLDIGDRNRQMDKGFGLVTARPNPMELRKHEYFLTPKGKTLLQHVLRHWRMGY